MSAYLYLASPYRAHPLGYDAAAHEAAAVAGWLIDRGVEVYSPIVHGHHIGRYVTAADNGSDFWLDRQLPFITAAGGIIVCQMAGWESSAGIAWERKLFAEQGKPEWLLQPFAAALPPGLSERARP